MKKVFYTITMVAALGLSSCGNNADTTETNTTTAPETAAVDTVTKSIDLGNSNIAWSGTMIGIYTHTGNMAVSSGELVMAGDQVIGGTITADLGSMVATDSNYTEEHPAENLIGHLSSPDFFAVEEFPTATYEITGTTENGGVIGNMTIRGKTNVEKAEIVSMENGVYNAVLVFDRQQYGVAWSSGAKDRVLSDDIELEIQIAVK